MSGPLKFPPYVGYDRTVVPEYGLPRQLNYDEVGDVMKARGKDLIEVTGRPYKAVLHSFGMRDGDIGNVKGQSILVGGEGASRFGQALESQGANVVAVDRLYRTPLSVMAERHLIYDYDGEYLVNLITPVELMMRLPKQTVGAELTALPFPDRTFDAVFIPNVVYWYLDKKFYKPTVGGDAKTNADIGYKIIDEALRVAKGYVHFNLADLKTVEKHANKLSEIYPDIDVIVRPNANIRLERPQKQTPEPDAILQRKR